MRDCESTTNVSSLAGIKHFGPCLRRDALRGVMGEVQREVLLILTGPTVRPRWWKPSFHANSPSRRIQLHLRAREVGTCGHVRQQSTHGMQNP